MCAARSHPIPRVMAGTRASDARATPGRGEWGVLRGQRALGRFVRLMLLASLLAYALTGWLIRLGHVGRDPSLVRALVVVALGLLYFFGERLGSWERAGLVAVWLMTGHVLGLAWINHFEPPYPVLAVLVLAGALGAAWPLFTTARSQVVYWGAQFLACVAAVLDSDLPTFHGALFVAGSGLLAVLGLVVAREGHRLSEALAEREHRLALVVQGLADALVSVSADGTWRKRWVRPGWDLGAELDPARVARCLGDEARAAIDDALARARRSGRARAVEIELELDGESRHLELVLVPAPGETFECMVRETTARHRLAEQLEAANRLAAIGRVAAGVAHEINNPLAYVVANLEYVRDELKREDDMDAGTVRDAIADAIEGAARVRKVVDELRRGARPTPAEPETIDVNDAVRGACAIMDNQVRHRASLELDLEPDLLARADETALTQVVVNLIDNAVRAMPEGRPGNRLRIRTAEEGGRVVVEVADNGTGMEPEVLERVFEPFFTTRGRGGMGLGMYLAKNTIRRFGGGLRVDSTPGGGTVVRIDLTPADQTREVVRAPREAPRQGEPGRLRVLLVDDDAAVARGMGRLLRARHEVVVETDPHRALDRLVREDYDVVLCDLMMPGLTGAELYRRAVGYRRELADRFVFLTGGSFTDSTDAFLAEVQAPTLHKPMSRARLYEALDAFAVRRRAA